VKTVERQKGNLDWLSIIDYLGNRKGGVVDRGEKGRINATEGLCKRYLCEKTKTLKMKKGKAVEEGGGREKTPS